MTLEWGSIIAPDQALPGRDEAMAVPERHRVLGTSLTGPFDPNLAMARFAMGCFWGAERLFWRLNGVFTTAVGYAGGYTPNPLYEEVCSGRTGHAEVVHLAYDPARIAYDELLRVFWEGHDPTQGLRQGNDIGSQYRSAIYWFDEEQKQLALHSGEAYDRKLRAAGHAGISTEIKRAGDFYFAESYHQQYLDKNPGGYCGLGGTGVCL